MSIAAGTVLQGRYEIVEVLGEGAMSTVYLVNDTHGLKTQRALKALEPRGATPQEATEADTLFTQEINMLRTLDHPCIPQYRDAFYESGARYFVMDYVDGRTLEKIVDANGPAPESYVLPIAIQLVKLLAWLHAKDIVFRDVKPSNVMVDYEGRVHLIDFGVARYWKPGQVADTFPMGTPGFAAPEQYGTAQSGPSTDLYAMAATIYRTLTGQDPDPTQPRLPLRAAAPTASQEMEAILAGCLQPDAAQRPQDAADVLEDLLKLHADKYPHVDVPELPSSAAPPQPQPVKRGPGALFGCVCVLFVLFVAAILWSNLQRPHRTGGQATACKSNLKNIGTALEMYSTDNTGRFPTSLRQLTPNYLKTIPSCPSIGSDTYSAGFVSSAGPDAYTAVCSGTNHAAINYSANYPQYTSWQGLLER